MWFSLASLGISRRFPGILCEYGNSSLRRQLFGTSFAVQRRWNADEDDRLKELCLQGFTYQQIGAELNRSHSSLDGRIRKIKLDAVSHTKKSECKFWNAEEDALLLEKFEQGMSRKELTNLFPGQTYCSVRARLRTVRLAAYGHEELLNESLWQRFKYTDMFIQRLKHLRLKEAKTFAEIAVDLNCASRPLKALWARRVRPFLSKEERESLHAQLKWTPEETKHLLELQHRGTMIDDVFLQFPSRSRHSVHCKITRSHLRFPGRLPRVRQITAFKPATPSAASGKDGIQSEEQG